MAAPPAPLDAAYLAAIANEAQDYKKHVICDAVAKHVRERTPVTCHADFWRAVAKTLSEQGMERGHDSIRKEYNSYRTWAIANRTGKDGDERKHLKNVTRRARAGGAARAAESEEKAGEEEEKAEEEEEEEGEEEENAPTGLTWSLPLRPAGQASEQVPPATFGSLAFRPKQ